jgi:hypothetical protein
MLSVHSRESGNPALRSAGSPLARGRTGKPKRAIQFRHSGARAKACEPGFHTCNPVCGFRTASLRSASGMTVMGLTRASMRNFRDCGGSGWIAGSSPAMTKKTGANFLPPPLEGEGWGGGYFLHLMTAACTSRHSFMRHARGCGGSPWIAGSSPAMTREHREGPPTRQGDGKLGACSERFSSW